MRTHSHVCSRAGFALIDVCVSMTMLVIAMGVLLGSTFSAMKLDQSNECTAIANQALRGVCESLSSMSPDEVVSSLYVPPGASAPATPRARLAIPPSVLRDVHGQPLVIQARFPFSDAGEVREDLDLPELGLPRDLDGDGAIDALDHSADYLLLPVSLQLDWEGPSGLQSVRMSTVLRRP